jgi:AmmeMemoRadiSam system protein A
MEFSDLDRQYLLDLARRSIGHGLLHRAPLVIDSYEPRWQEPRASFVTLKLAGQLRGCIGRLEARYQLPEDVARNAYAAAFEDPRFRAVAREESERLWIQISVLSSPEALSFASEGELMSQIKPGRHGLIIEREQHRATYLPSVWEQISETGEFLAQLKIKAGISGPPERAWRYTTESFSTS